MTKDVLLIRHGLTDWNLQQRWQGHSDIPLNAEGIRQAERVAEELSRYELEVLFSSDLARAEQTAQIISQRHALPVLTTKGLREVNVGAAEGLGYVEALERLGEESLVRWRSLLPGDLDFAFPRGETKIGAARRAVSVIAGFLHGTIAERVGVVSHGMLIRMFLHHLFPQLNLPTVLPNCGYVRVHYNLAQRRWSLAEQESVPCDSKSAAFGHLPGG